MPNISRDAEVLPSGDDLRATDEWKQDQRQQAPQHNFRIWLYDGPYKPPFAASCRKVAFSETMSANRRPRVFRLDRRPWNWPDAACWDVGASFRRRP